MRGKRLGLAITAGIFVAVVCIGIWLAFELAPTPPTAFSLDPQNFAALSPPSIAPPIVDQNEAGDVGPIYLAALAAYANASQACEDFAMAPTDSPPRPIALLLDAAHKSTAKIFAADPARIIDYQSEHPPLDDLSELGHKAVRAGLMFKLQKKTDQARRYFSAAYALGENLYSERLSYDEYLKGLGLLDEATVGLSECEPPGSQRRSQLEAQEQAMVDYDQTHVLPIYKLLSSADQDVIAASAGDVYQFAVHSSEKMFRVEAILKLGRYRFDAERKADQIAAPRRLRELATQPDPAIRAAAKAALDLTLEQYRTIH